jgi:hypothetical protein
MRYSQKHIKRVGECRREAGEYDTRYPMVQFGKLVKKVGELIIAIGDSNTEGIKDAIGDIRACLIGVCVIESSGFANGHTDTQYGFILNILDTIQDVHGSIDCGSKVPMEDILSIATSLDGIADAWNQPEKPQREEDEHIFWHPGELPECFRGKGYVEELEVLVRCLWSRGCRGSLWETNLYCMKTNDYERLTAVEPETPEETLPDGWVAHTGDECPVDPDVEVMVRIAEDTGFHNRVFWGTCAAGVYRWDKLYIAHHITHYKVVNAPESSVTKKSQ